MSYKMVRNCMVDPLHVINMCCHEKTSECYISQFLNEVEIDLLVVGLAYVKMRWLIKGPR